MRNRLTIDAPEHGRRAHRSVIGYVALFAVTFTCTLGLIWNAGPAVEHPDTAVTVATVAQHAAQDRAPPVSPPARSAVAPVPADTDLAVISIAAAQAGAPEEEHDASPQERADRAWMMRTLGESASPASVQALTHVLASSGERGERLEAVAALARIGATGVAVDDVRRALESARSDRSAEVAASAREALQRL